MTLNDDARGAGRPKPAGGSLLSFLLAAALALAPTPGAAQPSPDLRAALQDAPGASRDVRAFYRARDHRPLWIRNGRLGPEADALLRLIGTADLDGLDPDDYRPQDLAEAVAAARTGAPTALARAEMQLSRRFADYVRDLRQPRRDSGMIYAERDLTGERPDVRAVLDAAAAAPSLAQYLEANGWMHPFYGRLRATLAASQGRGAGPRGALSAQQQRILYINLGRLRALPADTGQRYILVDAAGARLWAFEGGRVRETMRVVVGRVTDQTPMIAGRIRYAVVNPYWNVPPDLVPTRIAPNVLSHGIGWFRARGYQVLSDWSDRPHVVPADTIDWRVAAAGRQTLRVRQLPGPENGMGRIKFLFPNELGVYLHDTPERGLMREPARQYSAGCVRVEDASRLARWLFGRPLETRGSRPEHYVPLPQPVPVYITYLTAAPEGERVVFRRDVYNRDSAVRVAHLVAG